MSVINPPMYKEYMKQKDNPVTEVATFKEDMSEEEFKTITSMAHDRFGPEMLEEAKKRADEKKTGAGLPMATHMDAQSAVSTKSPSTWVRPAEIPPMRQVGGPPEQSEDNETDINPIVFEKRKP